MLLANVRHNILLYAHAYGKISDHLPHFHTLRCDSYLMKACRNVTRHIIASNNFFNNSSKNFCIKTFSRQIQVLPSILSALIPISQVWTAWEWLPFSFHKINSHKSNCHKINSHGINLPWDQFSRDQLVTRTTQFYYFKINIIKTLHRHMYLN